MITPEVRVRLLKLEAKADARQVLQVESGVNKRVDHGRILPPCLRVVESRDNNHFKFRRSFR